MHFRHFGGQSTQLTFSYVEVLQRFALWTLVCHCEESSRLKKIQRRMFSKLLQRARSISVNIELRSLSKLFSSVRGSKLSPN